MRLHITEKDGNILNFGNVMSIKANAETNSVDIYYSNALGLWTKSYSSGQWQSLILDPIAKVDYDLPKGALK